MDFRMELKYIYDDNYRWLVFAEAKHVAIVTFLVAAISLLHDKDSVLFIDNILRYSIMFLLCISLLISLSSFLPWLNRNNFCVTICKKYIKIHDENPIFYRSIFNMSLKESCMGFADRYYDCLYEKYCNNNRGLIEANDDIINQIIDISKVTTIKYYLFYLSLKITLLNVLGMIILVITA